VSELALDDVDGNALARKFDGVRMSELVLVPTSAQAPLGRHARCADPDEEALAYRGARRVLIGITRAPLTRLSRSRPEERVAAQGDDAAAADLKSGDERVAATNVSLHADVPKKRRAIDRADLLAVRGSATIAPRSRSCLSTQPLNMPRDPDRLIAPSSNFSHSSA